MVSDPVISGGRMVLDDGTGLVELGLSNDFALRQWKSGFDTIFSIFDFCSHVLVAATVRIVTYVHRDVPDGCWCIPYPHGGDTSA